MDSVDVKSHVTEDNEFVIFFGRQEFFLSSLFNLWSLKRFQMSKLKEKKKKLCKSSCEFEWRKKGTSLDVSSDCQQYGLLPRQKVLGSLNYASSLLGLIRTAFSNVTL